MELQKIQTYIDQAVGTEGILRIPSWWMRKILTDILNYIHEKGEQNISVDLLKSELYKNLSQDDINLLTERGILNTINSEFLEVDNTLAEFKAKISDLETNRLVMVVDQLPSNPKSNTIYLVPASLQSENNFLDEWLYVGGQWEKVGVFNVDISDFVKQEQLYFYAKSTDVVQSDWLDEWENSKAYIRNKTHGKHRGSRIFNRDFNPNLIYYLTFNPGEYEIVSNIGSVRFKLEDLEAGNTCTVDIGEGKALNFQKLDKNQLPATHALSLVTDETYEYVVIYEIITDPLAEEYIPDTIARKSYVDNLDIPKTIVVEDSMLSSRDYVIDLYNTLIECDFNATVKYRKDNRIYDCYIVYKDPNFERIHLLYLTMSSTEVVTTTIWIYKNGESNKNTTTTFTNQISIYTFNSNDSNPISERNYKGYNTESQIARFFWKSNPNKDVNCNIEYVCKGGSLEFPNDIFWRDGKLPEFKKYHRYIININNQMGKVAEFYRKIVFTVDSEEFEFYLDATLENFINDGVDPNFEIGNQIENTGKFGVLYKGAKLLSEDNIEVSVSDLLIDGHKYVTQKAHSLDDLMGTYNFSNSGTSLGATKPTLSKNGNDIVFTNLLGGGPEVVVTFDATNNTITVPKGWTSTYVGPVDVDLVFNVDFDTHTLTMTPSGVTIGGWASITNYVLTKV